LGDLRLQRVSDEDLVELLPLLREYCAFNGVEHTDAQLLGLSRALIADPERQGLQIIARDDRRQPSGFATLVWTWATWAGGRVGIMGDVYVAAWARRLGTGRALIEACRSECHRVAVRGLMWSTAKDNAAARSLSESVGAHSREWIDYWLDT
jgi:GNAT superfamily N-acetyltransferase